MDRRRFLLSSLAGAMVQPLAAGAQPVGKIAPEQDRAVRNAARLTVARDSTAGEEGGTRCGAACR